QPELDEALRDRGAVARLLAATLRRMLVRLGASGDDPLLRLVQGADEGAGAAGAGVVEYPGLWALAYRLQAERRAGGGDGHSASGLADVHRVLDAARDSALRAGASASAGWSVDLTPPEPHLTASLVRAVAETPRCGREAEIAEMTLTPWGEEQREVFGGASGLLGELWPELLAELAQV